MNLKKLIAIATTSAMLVLSASCGNSTNSSPGSTEKDSTPSPTGAYSDSVVAAVEGPKLMFSNVEAAPGETAEISLIVSGAHKNWTMCGIHVTFGEDLECVMDDPANNRISYELGAASKHSSGSVGMLWVNQLPEELTSNHLGCLFFTEIFEGDMGGDGEIVKFFFKVPEKAKKGTVYPIGIYYMPPDEAREDMFRNSADDLSLEKYAFENWTGGSITVV